MRKIVGQTKAGRKDAGTMTVTLNRENTRNLRFTARMVDVEPDRLLNDWLLRDPLRDMRTGELRGLVGAIIYDNAESAATVTRNVIRYEKSKGFHYGPLAPVIEAKTQRTG